MNFTPAEREYITDLVERVVGQRLRVTKRRHEQALDALRERHMRDLEQREAEARGLRAQLAVLSVVNDQLRQLSSGNSAHTEDNKESPQC